MGFHSSSIVTVAVAAICVLSATPGHGQVCSSSHYFFYDLDGSLPPGVTENFTGFFQKTSLCRPPGSCGSGQYAYFGITSQCNYDTYTPSGSFYLSGVQLPDVPDIWMTYCSAYDGEEGCYPGYTDYACAYVVEAGGGGSMVEDIPSCTGPKGAVWHTRTLDLAQFAGKIVNIGFYFITEDGLLNDFYGWGVDDICISGPEWHQSPVNGHWYTRSFPTLWGPAEEKAQASGGHLATIRNQAENDWLTSNLLTYDRAWIGYNDVAVEGTFVWTSGETPGFENWRHSEPSGADFVVIAPGNGQWSAFPSVNERPGILEVISDDCDGNSIPDRYEIAGNPVLDWNGDGVLDVCSPPNYCIATANSTGVPAVIGASGSPVIAENALTLEAWDLPLQKFGYFLMSRSTNFVPLFGGSSGNLCLRAPIIRFNKSSDGGQVLNSGSSGSVAFTPDLDNLPQGTVFQPGETWHFQLWFRDTMGIPTSNTTDGFEVLMR